MDLNSLLLILSLLGLVALLAGSVMLLVAGFRQNYWWGLGILFILPVSFIFSFVHWSEAKRGALTVLLGVALLVAPALGSPEIRNTFAENFPEMTGLKGGTKNAEEKTKDLSAQILEKRDLLERLIPELAATGGNLGQEFKKLELQRKALKPDDTTSIMRFNELAAAYQAQNAKAQEIQRQISATEAELNTLLADRSKLRTGPARGSNRIVMYTTARCGACKVAKRYMGEKGIAYEERDVERSSSAMEEFTRLGGRGVPLILVGEKRLEGFSAQALEAML